MHLVPPLLERRVLGVPVYSILLVLGALAAAAATGLSPRMPLLVLGFIGAIAVLLLFIRRPIFGVGLVAALAITGGVTELFRGSIFSRLYVIVLGLTLLAYLHHLYADRQLLRAWLKIRASDLVLAGLLLIALLSTGVAAYPAAAAKDLGEIVRGCVLYLLVTRAIRSFDDLETVGKFLLVGGLWQASTAWGGGSFSATDGNDVVRLSGNLQNANSYAAALLMVLPFAFYFAVRGRGLWRLAGLVGAVLLPITLLGSVSRTAMVVLVILALLWPLLSARSLDAKLRLLVPVLLICVYALALRWDTLIARWPTLQALLNPEPVTFAVDDDGGRSTLRALGWQIFVDNWPLGVGVGNTQHVIGELRNTYQPFHVHNMFVEVAADLGLFGLLFFCGLIGLSLLQPLFALPRLSGARERALAASAACLPVVLAVYGFVGNRHYATSSFFLIAAALAAGAIAWQAAKPKAQEAPWV